MNKNTTKVLKFILLNIVIFTLSLFVSFKIHNRFLKKKNKEQISVTNFLNSGQTLTFKGVAIGLTFGIVFGFLDNFGLWIGINELQDIFPGGLLTKSALGNTYSDMLGAIVGTSIAIIAQDVLDYDNDKEPIWLNVIGIFIGCILGLFAGRLITGKS